MAPEGAPDLRPSLSLPFDPNDVMQIRVRPADYSRMCGVSKQTVSTWIKKGWITLEFDGRLNPGVATQQLLRRVGTGKLRSRLFRQASQSLDELRARVRALEAELTQVRGECEQREQAAQARTKDEASVALTRFTDAIAARFDQARAAHDDGTLLQWLDELAAVEFYGHDLDAYRAMWAADECAAPELPTSATTDGDL